MIYQDNMPFFLHTGICHEHVYNLMGSWHRKHVLKNYENFEEIKFEKNIYAYRDVLCNRFKS